MLIGGDLDLVGEFRGRVAVQEENWRPLSFEMQDDPGFTLVGVVHCIAVQCRRGMQQAAPDERGQWVHHELLHV